MTMGDETKKFVNRCLEPFFGLSDDARAEMFGRLAREQIEDSEASGDRFVMERFLEGPSNE